MKTEQENKYHYKFIDIYETKDIEIALITKIKDKKMENEIINVITVVINAVFVVINFFKHKKGA